MGIRSQGRRRYIRTVGSALRTRCRLRPGAGARLVLAELVLVRLGALVGAAADVQVLYITVDPQRDDAVRLKKYLGGFDPTFVGGTGTEQQLAAVRKSYGISAEKHILGDSYTYEHSSFTYLIDRRGR